MVYIKVSDMFRNSLFVIAFCGLLASCSTKQELEQREMDGVIRLGVAKIADTKAEVRTMTDLGNNIGIYGVQLPNKTASGWGNALSMENVRSSAVSASGAISWDGIYYYPVDPSHFVKFCAYYPYADGSRFSIEAPASGKAPALQFTLSGTDDLLFAEPVVGSRNDSPAPLSFQHALTQLKFVIEDATGALADRILESIVVEDANTVSSMNIENGTFGAWSAPATLHVPGIEGKNITFTAGTPLTLDEGIMLQPGLKSFNIRLAIADQEFTYPVEIKPTSEETFAAGKSYKITLTFNENIDILVGGAVVSNWLLMGYDDITIK